MDRSAAWKKGNGDGAGRTGVHAHARTRTHTNKQKHKQTHTRTPTNTSEHAHTHTPAPAHVHARTHAHAGSHTHTHTYKHTRTQTQTHAQAKPAGSEGAGRALTERAARLHGGVPDLRREVGRLRTHARPAACLVGCLFVCSCVFAPAHLIRRGEAGRFGPGADVEWGEPISVPAHMWARRGEPISTYDLLP